VAAVGEYSACCRLVCRDMLFPLSKDFSSSSIFQKGGEHHQAPIKRVWTIDHTGSKDRTKELHLLLTDQKPYSHHERLATKRANDGKKADADRLSAFREDLREMHAKIDGESAERKAEMLRGMRAYRRRKASSESDLRATLRDQGKDHKDFLADMNARTWQMQPIWGKTDEFRETKERTRARGDASRAVVEQTKDYKQMIKGLEADLGNRGPQDWTAVPKPCNETIVRHRKAAGLAKLTQDKTQYEAFLDDMDGREHQRALGERHEIRGRVRDSELRLAGDKTTLLKSLNDTNSMKKAELDGIQARVNGRGNGDPNHHEFNGYATAGYAPVDKSSKRLRDHAAEAQDKDADHTSSAAKLLCLSMPLNLRNRIVAGNHPKKAASLMGTGIDTPMEWSEMNWTQRWALLSRHAPQSAIQKAQQRAGVDPQGLDMSMTAASATDVRTLSPRTLGMAAS